MSLKSGKLYTLEEYRSDKGLSLKATGHLLVPQVTHTGSVKK